MSETIRSIIRRRTENLQDKYPTTTQTIGNTMAAEENTDAEVPVLTVDGVNYPVDSLPGDVQELITYYQSWKQEHEVQKLAAFKTEAAMRALTAEIQNRVRAMVAQILAAQEAAREEQAANDSPQMESLDIPEDVIEVEATEVKDSPTLQ